MLHVAYTLTPDIRALLEDVKQESNRFLLTVVHPSVERKIRFQTRLKRMYWIQNPPQTFSLAEIQRFVLGAVPKRMFTRTIPLFNYAKLIDHIHEQWTLNAAPITLQNIEELSYALERGTKAMKLITMDYHTLKQLLNYLQTLENEPVVAASIAYSQWCILTDRYSPQPLAFLLAYIFLSKGGMNMRNALCLEQELVSHPREYTHALEAIKQSGSSTEWIRVFCSSLARYITKLRTSLETKDMTTTHDDLYRITPRQQEILSLLDGLESLTNKQVQKRFRVSQVTASRELGKLTALGLLLSHGKGRSVYYTRV